MEKAKTSVAEISDFLANHYPDKITEVEPVEGGETSRAFGFLQSENPMIIRINDSSVAFEKDKYSYEKFESPRLPIPRIVEIGQFNDDYFFAISERKRGVTIDKLSPENAKKVLPDLISVLDEIHRIDIGETSGYGNIDETGEASFDSWRDYILGLSDEENYSWSRLDKETFFEKEIFDKAYQKIVKLIDYCPERRFLVHGDYGFNNVVTDGNTITGVLDWGESKYGDFVYDAAWLDFWSGDIRYADFLQEHYQKEHVDIPSYMERIACYKLHLGTGALSFYAVSNQKEKYDFAIELVRLVLKQRF